MSAWNDSLCAGCFAKLPVGVSVCPLCGFDNAASRDISQSNGLLPFTVIGSRYILGRVLGAGGFGITYVAYDTEHNLKRAVKEYFPVEIASRDPVSGVVRPAKKEDYFKSGLEKFASEAELLKKLQYCRSIVSMQEFFRENGTAYMVMEFVEGDNLKNVMRKYGGCVPYNLAYTCFVNTALALNEAHSVGVLHRDVSPENIILQNGADIKLIDFGAAKLAHRGSGQNEAIMLKPGYAPPEQYSANGQQGPWTDVYALACTFYRIVSGAPVPDAKERMNGAPVPPLHTVAPDVPINVSMSVRQAMELDINKRYRTMNEFIAALTAYNEKTTTRSGIYNGENYSGERQGVTAHKQSLMDRFDTWYAKTRRPAASLILNGIETQSVIMSDGVPVKVGRLESCDIICQGDPRISRIHCLLTYNAANNSVTVEDTSSNGTLLPNGFWLRRGETCALRATSEIRLASSESIIRVVIRS